MRALALIALYVWLSACATALKREGQCLASLTPEVLRAQDEVAELEAAWRAAQRGREQEELRRLGISLAPQPDTLRGAAPAAASAPDPLNGSRMDGQQETQRVTPGAYQKLVDARTRYQQVRAWYDKVQERFRTRLQEEQILSDVRWTLLTGPALIFYPIIRWNVRSVLWDATDPDADSDPVTQYCTNRLANAEAGE